MGDLTSETVYTGAANCFKYACKKSDQNFIDNTCTIFIQADNTYYSQPCADTTKACMLNATSDNYTCQVPVTPPPPTAFAYPGEKCTATTDCLYSAQGCVNNTCVGLTAGQPCTTAGISGQCAS